MGADTLTVYGPLADGRSIALNSVRSLADGGRHFNSVPSLADRRSTVYGP